MMLMPRTIDKLRAMLPGGNLGEYYLNGPTQGISGYLLQRLGIDEKELFEAVRVAKDDGEVAQWLRQRVDPAVYLEINQTLRRIKPEHIPNPEEFRSTYVETMQAHPEIEHLIDIVVADDRRMFGSPDAKD
ncbi:MAG: DUF5069 domain-containing protein [Candidatus Eremiobacteraeota bacterium]|nr:DUF5069 domain-containing protein [Candidatus Eremiobacteraeota bacterium]